MAGGGGIIHGADGDVAMETTTTSTTTTASSSAAVPALLDERDDGGIAVHPSLVHALGSRRATTTAVTAVAAAPPLRPRPSATRDPPVAVAVAIATGELMMRPPPGEGSSKELLPVPRSGRQQCPTDPNDDPPGPGALSPPLSCPPLPPWGDPDGPASGAAATTQPDLGIDGSGGGLPLRLQRRSWRR